MQSTASEVKETIVDTSTNASSQDAVFNDSNTTDNPENEKGVLPTTDIPTQPPASPRDAHGLLWLLIVTCILMANFLFATDNTVAANVQPAVVNDFESLDKLAWLPLSFFAASWGTNLLWGDIYARFSSKWTFCTAFVVFSIGCAVCGSAPTMNALIVGRAICGMGGAGMYYGTMALLTKLTSERERPLYLNIVGVTFGAGTVLGPIIGGAFADSGASWRWAFYFNLVVGGVCAPVYIFLLPTLNPRPGQTMKQRALEIDYLGTILLCSIILSIIMAISFGGVEYSWNSGQIIALFVVSFTLLILFFIQQHFTIFTSAPHRVFPMHFLKSPTMVVLFLEMACASTCVFVPVYFLPLYFQFVKADSAITAGVRMIPFVAPQTVIAILSGWAVGKTGFYVPWYIFAGALCVPGAALLFVVNQYTPLANVYGYEILLGFGSGASTQLSMSVASIKLASTPEDIGRGTGWEAFAQLGGPSISLSIANSVFLNKAQLGIAKMLPDMSRSDISTIISDPSSRLLRDLPEDVQERVVDVVVGAMRDAYILCIIAGALILLLIFRFKVGERLYG